MLGWNTFELFTLKTPLLWYSVRVEKIEKEIKVKIADYKILLDKLLKSGAVVLNKSKEKTIRLDTPNMDLEKRGVFLRVRSGSKNTITMKEKIGEDKNVRSRKETEFEISDVDQMAYILEKLGFTLTRIMEKYRINLQYKGAILSIDEMPFGMYLEVEGTEEQIETITAELGYSTSDKVLGTYWDVFEEYKKENNLTGENIVFPENYKSKMLELIN